MPYFKMVRMEFTCILYTNTFLVGRYWDFNAFADDKLNFNKKSKLALGRVENTVGK